MSNPGVIITDIRWKDKAVTELSREEMLECIRWAFNQINHLQEDHRRTLSTWKTCREARFDREDAEHK